ncbi:MAG: PHP domain-containing protein [Clostridia bacterium]|nr:PHP domain-containing protein [Clostridia bacterium]
MKLSYDLHIHTALSPCASDDMTPNNIVNMSLLKGLDVIAITDHNSVENCAATIKAAENKDIIVIPGMELQTAEDVHLLCFFEKIEQAFELQEMVNEKILKMDNNPSVLGNQHLLNHEDEIIGEKKEMLLISSGLSLNDAISRVKSLDGVPVPAHIDRGHNSLIVNLGFVPENLNVNLLEISQQGNLEQLMKVYKNLRQYHYITNSDAHYLGNISERIRFIEAENKTVKAVIEALKQGGGLH